MKRILMLLVFCFGCTKATHTEPIEETGVTPPQAPTIDTFELTCDLTLERWQLDVRTDAWTGGGEWWWTVDGVYVEKHDITSRKAASDGTWDELRLRLDIVADWRDAVRNASTPFLCANTPTGRLFIRDMSGTIVECYDTGPNIEWVAAFSEWPDCP